MANVKRCDICGGIFELVDEVSTKSGVFSTHEKRFDMGEHIDCCPACTIKIVDFIDILKTGEPYKIWIDPPEEVIAAMKGDKK